MSLPNPKEIKKLADACRKAGIAHFKCDSFEFTLSPQAQSVATPKPKSTAAGKDSPIGEAGEWDSLSEEAKLFWSIGNFEGANAQ